MLHNMQVLTHSLIHNPMSKIYFYRALIAFVTSLVGIFVPVYLYSLGFDLIMILIYTIGVSLTYIIFAPTVIASINKFGLKCTLLFSAPAYLIYLSSIQYVTESIFYFHILWLSQGIYMALFWISFKAEVISNGNAKTRGSEIGTLQIIVTLVTAIAPLIGGIYLEYFSYWNLFLFASFFLVLSNLPLLMSKDKKIHKINFKHSDYIRLIKKTTNKKTKIAHASEGIELILSTIIWPIIFFIFIKGSFAKLGMLYTGLSIITIISLIIMKSYIDKHSKKKVLKITSKLLAFSWFGRTILAIFGSVFLYLFESFAKLISNVVTVTFSSIFYNNTNSKNYLEALLTRTIYMHGTKILFCSLVIFILLFIENTFLNYTMILTFGIISSIGLNAIVEHEIY
jgi:MFS family permease